MKTDGFNAKTGERTVPIVFRQGSPLPLSNRGNDFALRCFRGLARAKTWRFALLLYFCCLIFVFRLRSWGQSYSVDWYKISDGGGTSTGGTYQVSGTIGQLDASGAMSGGQYSVTGGFWSLYAVQTPGAPLLTITYACNQAVVSWSPSISGWTLQTNANVSAPSWGNYLGSIVTVR